ncbi:ABC transporter permease [Pseudodonghicola sp.]|uniref:ABC transporter permease n=1 Tax=Pseudodonghicola sp. TaxID=1969463 RepID=UPI003A968CA6
MTSLSLPFLRMPALSRSTKRALLFAVLPLLVIVLAAIFAPLLTQHDPTFISPRKRLAPPGATFWFGADALGRDLYARVIYGARVSLTIGFLVCILALAIGTFFGLISGVSRAADAVMMRVMDGFMAIPGILLAVTLVSLFGASLFSVVLAIAFPDIPRVTRIVRSVVLSAREEPYVEAAMGVGVPRWKVVFRHILPNCIAPLTVQGTYIFASAILVEAVLGFLGVGYPPSIPTWGNILAEGRAHFQAAPWTIVFAGAVRSITVLCVNGLGDVLRAWLDPKFAPKEQG